MEIIDAMGRETSRSTSSSRRVLMFAKRSLIGWMIATMLVAEAALMPLGHSAACGHHRLGLRHSHEAHEHSPHEHSPHEHSGHQGHAHQQPHEHAVTDESRLAVDGHPANSSEDAQSCIACKWFAGFQVVLGQTECFALPLLTQHLSDYSAFVPSSSRERSHPARAPPVGR